MELQTLQELLFSELRELYSAEKQIVAALPKMAKAATSRQLRGAFKEHLKETEGHIDRLKAICEDMGVSPSGKTNEAIEGLIRQGEALMDEEVEPEVLDAGLIATAQKVEHYEIAGYGTVRTYAELLGRDEIARTLQLTLNEEKQADRKLTAISDQINVRATRAGASRRRLWDQDSIGSGEFVLGMGLGAAIGVLFAPMSGRRLRERATGAAWQAAEKVSDVARPPESREAGD